MTRRSFMTALAGLVPAGLLARVVRATPKAVPGVSYFRAVDIDLPEGKSIYLDGRDVKMFSCEANLIEGWVRVYRNKENRILLFDFDQNGKPFREMPAWNDYDKRVVSSDMIIDKLYGRVEVR